MLSVLINPDHMAGHAWTGEAEAMVAYLHSCAPVVPEHPVLLPGEPEAQARDAAQREGISYPAAIWDALTALAADLSVALPPQAA
jgi:LDH2 family malate/lactate/ureidoglycolate dehydrogenase